ncbi:MAG: non-homologous end-joining DNA ligase [Dehalococcoidia bacterium]
MTSALDSLSRQARERLRKREQPSWTAPMLATLTHDYFSDPGWIFERKLYGERCLAFRKGKEVRLLSRNRKELNDTYPELVEALREQEADDFIVDGEIVAFEGNRTSFSRLQQRMELRDPEEAVKTGVAVYYYLFDLLYLDGHDTTQLDLRDRKMLLKRVLSFKEPLRFTAHRNTKGEAYHEEACRKGWEGIIAKRADSKYVHSRSRDWLKFKCVNEQEFVVGGYTDPKGSRVGFGAVLIGYYEGDDLVYAGQVGTGYNEDTLRRLKKRLSSIEREEPPFAGDDLPRKGIHWVEPKLVAQVGFTEWTDEGKLRHPRFLGLRRDKEARQVVREKA